MMLQIGQLLSQHQSQEIKMIKLFITIFLFVSACTNMIAQNEDCSGYEIIKDSIGTPMIKNDFFLREVGIKQNGKIIGLPNDRLLQYSFFVLRQDSINLIGNYENGIYAYINSFSLMRDSFTKREIIYKEGVELNQKLTQIKSFDTLNQNIKKKRKVGNTRVGELFFEYEIYKLKISTVYIGKYCRKVPYKIIEKNKPLFIDKAIDVYVILDILHY
jgi:hypothetical protein